MTEAQKIQGEVTDLLAKLSRHDVPTEMLFDIAETKSVLRRLSALVRAYAMITGLPFTKINGNRLLRLRELLKMNEERVKHTENEDLRQFYMGRADALRTLISEETQGEKDE